MVTYERERISEINPEAVLWDGLDEAIIGVTTDGRVVYDIEMMCGVLWRQNKNLITPEEAREWVDFNILSAYVGEYTPVHIWVINDEEEYDDFD